MYFIMISQQNCNLQRAMSYLLRARALPSPFLRRSLSAPLLAFVGLSAPSLAGLAPMPLAPSRGIRDRDEDFRRNQDFWNAHASLRKFPPSSSFNLLHPSLEFFSTKHGVDRLNVTFLVFSPLNFPFISSLSGLSLTQFPSR